MTLETNLKSHVVFLSEKIGERNYLDTEKLNKAADYIEEKFRSYKCNVKRQSFKAENKVYYNIEAEVKGASDKDKISMAVNECRRMKIKVLSPDINESNIGFTIQDGAIRFGLSAVKNVGAVAIDIILTARKKGKFESFADFLSRVDARKVNKKVLESLIKVGAMNMFGGRSALLASIDRVREKVSVPKGDDNQPGLFAIGDLKKTEAA